ncbi:unnamed protein product [marine sediment metagenome]|uniref:Uncharacterized protein n=1 Tax=marine sediment metagenome TaxID=412755 RepID=X1GI18_9ZZZZ
MFYRAQFLRTLHELYTRFVELEGKIDEETGKSHSYHIPIPRSGKELAPLTLKSACNVGDFIIVEDKVYRRVRGGFNPATDDELAELLAAKLGEALEE